MPELDLAEVELLAARLAHAKADLEELEFGLVRFASGDEFRRQMSVPFFRSTGVRDDFPFREGRFRWAGGIVCPPKRAAPKVDEEKIPSIRATHAWVGKLNGPCEVGFVIGPSLLIQKHAEMSCEITDTLGLRFWDASPASFRAPAYLLPRVKKGRRIAIWMSCRNWGRTSYQGEPGTVTVYGRLLKLATYPEEFSLFHFAKWKLSEVTRRPRGRPKSDLVAQRNRRLRELRLEYGLKPNKHVKLTEIALRDDVIQQLAKKARQEPNEFVNPETCRNAMRFSAKDADSHGAS